MIRTDPNEPPAEGEACEIAPGVLWFQLPLPFRPDTVNAFALRDDADQGGGCAEDAEDGGCFHGAIS